jgi:hypothetical protein
MLTYDVRLVPGPTHVPESVRRAYLVDYGSADLGLVSRGMDILAQILAQD